jgi:transcriptional regulator with XRE-family HTH domain
MGDFDRERLWFAEQLRSLRVAAGVSGRSLATQLEWPQSRVSKFETGAQLPHHADLVAWCEATGAAPEAYDALHHDLVDLRLEYTRRRRRGVAPRDVALVDALAYARRICSVDCGVVPELVQTAAFAAHLTELDRRLQRPTDGDGGRSIPPETKAEYLEARGRDVGVLVGEAALRYAVTPSDVMRDQIDALVDIIDAGRTRVGVLRLDRPLPFVPKSGYWIVDDAVYVEYTSSTVRLFDEASVTGYREVTELLWSSAVEGDEAREHLLAIATAYV